MTHRIPGHDRAPETERYRYGEIVNDGVGDACEVMW